MSRTFITKAFSLALLLALADVAQADSPPIALRSALTSGGGALAASGYLLTGAIGQPLAGLVATQGQYGLTSGLFGEAVNGNSHMYVGIVRR